jgi:hypothetical protein
MIGTAPGFRDITSTGYLSNGQESGRAEQGGNTPHNWSDAGPAISSGEVLPTGLLTNTYRMPQYLLRESRLTACSSLKSKNILLALIPSGFWPSQFRAYLL